VKCRHVRLQGDGAADLLDSAGMLSLLIVEHADQVQGRGIVLTCTRIFCYNCAAGPSWPD
jgi:hypothetical protein